MIPYKNHKGLIYHHGDVKIASPQGVIDESDVIFLAIMEDLTETILNSITFNKNQTIISFIL